MSKRNDSMVEPLVSIGVPVYNSEKYISETLASLLKQNYRQYELLISDNASTDQTSELCKAYAQKDKRIRYWRNANNMGMYQNFNKLIRSAQGKYFMLAGSHDLWDENFIGTCVEHLEAHPDTVLCTGWYEEIDANGNWVKRIPISFNSEGWSKEKRFAHSIEELGCCFAVYGLIRLDALRKTRLFLDTLSSDVILVAELSLLGKFYTVENSRMYVRAFPGRDLTEEENVHRLVSLQTLSSPNGWVMRRFPWTQHFFKLCGIIFSSKLSILAKVRLCRFTLHQYRFAVASEFTVKFMPTFFRQFLKRTLGKLF